MITPDVYSLELDITYACGFGCNNCNRMTQLVPGEKQHLITPGQLSRMLAESVELRYPWWRFSVLGGEPTTHPDFETIMTMVMEYKAKHRPGLKVRVATHGNGAHAASKLAWLAKAFPAVQQLNTRKTSRVQPTFDAVNVAPADLDPEWSSTHRYGGCRVASQCGIGFNYAGFYCCPIAGAIDRIFGLDLGLRHLRDLTPERLMATYDTFCSRCGHYRPTHDGSTTLISPTWRRALKIYGDAAPGLTSYGGDLTS